MGVDLVIKKVYDDRGKDLGHYIPTVPVDPLTGVPIDQTSGVSQLDIQKVLMLLLDRLDFGLITDNAKVLYVNAKTLPAVSIAAAQTVGTVTTVGTLSNISRQGDLQMQRVSEAILDAAFIGGITNNIAF